MRRQATLLSSAPRRLMVLAVWGTILLTDLVQAAPLEHQIVRLLVSKRDRDESSPWQFEDVVQQTHLGVVLADHRILTTAYAVASASDLALQRFGSSQKYELQVEFIDYEINLAVVSPKAEVKGLVPVAFGGELKIDDSVDIYRARDSDQLIKMTASLQDVAIGSPITSSYSALTYQLKIQQSGLGWSEPVFKDGKLVALCSGQDTQFVHAIPLPLIEHMLRDDLGPKYRGFPTSGLVLSPLVSPDMRRRLKMPAESQGVRVADVIPGSPFKDQIKPDDVITAIDGVPINEQGYFSHPKWGKVHLKYLLNQHYTGDILHLSILRQGASLKLSAPLYRYDSNRTPIIDHRHGQDIPHLIFGGLILQELSVDFLRQWGKDWHDIAPIHLLYALEYQNRPRENSKERIIFLSRILADPVNRGYGDIGRALVDKINGREVRSMDDVRQALTTPVIVRGRNYAQIQLALGSGEIILAYEDLAQAHKRMARTYEIPSTGSFFNWPR